jgi:ribosome-associated translation inhibitor RaiA
MEASPAVETRVRELTDHLGTFSDRIQSCRVVVDSPHRHHHQGKVFAVKVQLELPGEDVVVDMERPDRTEHEDVYVVLRDAFDAAKRQLQQRMSMLRGEPKLREKPVVT